MDVEDLKAMLEAAIKLEPYMHGLTGSIVAVVHKNGSNEHLLVHTDNALYRANTSRRKYIEEHQ